MAIPKGLPKTTQLQSAFKRLATTATVLNMASDDLTKSIAMLDESIKRLNLGVMTWMTFSGGSDDDDESYAYDEIGYAKINGKWGIALRSISGQTSPDSDVVTIHGEWLFNDAPREMRMNAISYIPQFIETLAEAADKMAQKIGKAAREARELARVLQEHPSFQTSSDEVRK